MARWRASKEAETGEKERRPYLASECTDVSKCEKWRLEIIREISKKVAQIQNGKQFVGYLCWKSVNISFGFTYLSFSWSWGVSDT